MIGIFNKKRIAAIAMHTTALACAVTGAVTGTIPTCMMAVVIVGIGIMIPTE